jgi:hypothetical protein
MYVFSVSNVMTPICSKAEYQARAAWPFDSTTRSRDAFLVPIPSAFDATTAAISHIDNALPI